MCSSENGLNKAARRLAWKPDYAVFLLPKGMTVDDLPSGSVSSIETAEGPTGCQNGYVWIGEHMIAVKCLVIVDQPPAPTN